MRTFFHLLITATIINTFISVYNSPSPTSSRGRAAGTSVSKNLAHLKNAYASNFNTRTGQIISGSLSRIHSLQNSRPAVLLFITGAAMPADLSRLVLQHRRKAQAVLRELQKYNDGWLLDMILVKRELVTLLENEITIWDSFLSIANAHLTHGGSTANHDLKEVKLSIEEYNAATERVKKSYKAILARLGT